MKAKNISTKTLLLYNLSKNEIENPTVILDDFCLHDHLPAHMEQLKHWRNLLISNKTYKRRNCPSDLFLHYRMTIKLLEAAWLLRERNTANHLRIEESEQTLIKDFIKKEQQEIKFYLTPLSMEELWDPGMAAKT